MKIPVLLQVEISISNSNIDDAIKEFPTLRMYLQEFKRTRSGMFISEALRDEKDTVLKDSIELRNALLDWSFNEDGDAKEFLSKYPEGFHFKCYKICDL